MDAYDFSKFQVVADIGGGQGSTLAAVLECYPSLQGLLFDKSYRPWPNRHLWMPAGYVRAAMWWAETCWRRCPMMLISTWSSWSSRFAAMPRRSQCRRTARLMCGRAAKSCRRDGVMPPVGVTGPAA